MATDYDAPRKNEDEADSIEALKERVPASASSNVDIDQGDGVHGFDLADEDLSDVEIETVVIPPQANEFTCMECFLIKHRSQLSPQSTEGNPLCKDCAGA
ncbi:DUF4193 domain-containing protein [Gulosibacter bifidus]|uniref:DUF4193 domain-containing protein n=1 Tax=Gulosibacter bifidus TaxID=272239 RepID=A0ABW5RFH7_9MICO|nr:DUF4193 domain-containing protein [Gulosibacter bifidus]